MDFRICRPSDKSVVNPSKKPIDLTKPRNQKEVKNLVNEIDIKNRKIGINMDNLRICTRKYPLEEIGGFGYNLEKLNDLCNTLKNFRNQKDIYIEQSQEELMKFVHGRFETGRTEMETFRRELENSIAEASLCTNEALASNRRIHEMEQEIGTYISVSKIRKNEKNILMDENTVLEVKNLNTLCKQLSKVSKTQKNIEVAMENWTMASEIKVGKSLLQFRFITEVGQVVGEKLIEQLVGDRDQLRTALNACRHPGDRSNNKATKKLIDDVAVLEKINRLYEHLDAYLPLVEDENYIGCLRKTLLAHKQVLGCIKRYDQHLENFEELREERSKKEKKIEEYENEFRKAEAYLEKAQYHYNIMQGTAVLENPVVKGKLPLNVQMQNEVSRKQRKNQVQVPGLGEETSSRRKGTSRPRYSESGSEG